MENYIVSARKYRPSTFESVVGQRALTTTLKNAIATQKLAHAYLFCGPRGVGKTTCARIFAKTINCMTPTADGEACNQCESCVAFNEQRSYNIHELDAASNNSVDDIRQLVEQVRIPPQIGKYKVYIIDEVHMLSTSAFNALLKTMEDSVRKYGTKLLILDNLTAINLECSDDNKYNKQSELIMNLIAFAVKFNVIVLLVVHPHKIDTMRRLNKMDVQGISAIIDLAHRIISLYRVSDKDKQGEPKLNGSGWRVKPIKEDVLIDILKDRMLGYEGRSVGVYYDQPSRRFFTSEEDLDRRYSWDKHPYVGGLPYPPEQLNDEEDEVFGTVDGH